MLLGFPVSGVQFSPTQNTNTNYALVGKNFGPEEGLVFLVCNSVATIYFLAT